MQGATTTGRNPRQSPHRVRWIVERCRKLTRLMGSGGCLLLNLRWRAKSAELGREGWHRLDQSTEDGCGKVMCSGAVKQG
mmetsp:Transcript_17753/g.45694  ORF Transcript_17753/g.45694 Transcript_17753/m.45694 type:complete len:80 (+) Transcript_17753:1235-1474(+)